MRSDLFIVGASGLVGRALLRACAADGVLPLAITRHSAPEADVAPLAQWYGGTGLDSWRAPDQGAASIATVIGAGPLDVLSHWLASASWPGLRQVVALSSTSVTTKPDSLDPAERDIAQRLMDGERRLIAACERVGASWTILRPTLIWGEGRDRNVSRLAALARRRGRIVLPRFACGLRQPIRAEDVAAALLAASRRPQAQRRCLDLPGGETLAYHDMASRIAAVVAPPGKVWRLPVPASAVACAARLRLLSSSSAAVLQRMRRDLVFDGGPATAALGVRAHGFLPCASDFPEH